MNDSEGGGGSGCTDCERTEEYLQSVWRDLKLQTCDRATAWARGVLDDADAVLLLQYTDHHARRPNIGNWSVWRVTDPFGRAVFETEGLNGPAREYVRDPVSGRGSSIITGDTAVWVDAYQGLDAALQGKRIILAARSWNGESWWAATARDLGLEPMRHTIAAGDDLNGRAHAWYNTMPDKAFLIPYTLAYFADVNHGSWALPDWTDGSYGGSIDELTAIATRTLVDMAAGSAPGMDFLDDDVEGVNGGRFPG